MPVYLEELEIVPENVTASTWVDYLVGNIFQKLNVRIQFRSQWFLDVSSSKPLYFADPQYKNLDWLTATKNLYAFKDLNVDDTIIFNSGGSSVNNQTYIISEKLNDYQIRLTQSPGGGTPTLTSQLETSGTLNLIQDPTGASLDFGLIENKEAVNFDSKVSQDLMRYELGVAAAPFVTGPTPMLPVGKLDWQLGSCTLTNLTSSAERDAYTYQFEFNQELYIHPFYLPEQILDLTNAFPIPPKYFKKENCLKYVTRIRMYRELQDDNAYQEGVFDDKVGNTGWFDEEYNGGTPAYSASNLVYSNTIGALDPRTLTSITFDIDTNLSVTTGVTHWVTLNFIVLPEKDNDYKNRNQLQQENYVWDRAQQFTGNGTPINGDQFGGGYEVISNMLVVAGTNKVTVTADIDFGSDALAKINTLSNGGYMLACYTNVGTAEPADSCHYVTMLIDVNEMETEITDDIVDVSTVFLFHDQNDDSIVTGGSTVKVEDEIVAESLILLDQTPTTGYPNAQIDAFSAQIVAKKTGEDDVILLEQDFLVAGNAMQGTVRSLNVSPVTGFEVNSSEIRHNFRAYRSPSDDIATEYAYRVQYPFLYRWEYWEKQILGTLPLDWYDSSEQHNGYNEEWFRIQGLTGWNIYHRLESTVSFDNVTKVINSDKLITPQDYLANTNWTAESITAFDGATALSYSGDPYIMENKQTTIKANFTDVSGLLGVSDVYMVARLIPKENGTFIANESLSSVYDRENKGLFIGDSSGKIAITLVGSVFTGEFDIDYNEIPKGMLEYTLSVSIGVDSAVAMTDFGEVQTQDMLVLEVIDFDPPVIPKDANPFIKCCYPLKVFGNVVDKTDEFRNDFSAPLMIFPLQYTVTMKLEKLVDGVWTFNATLTGSTIFGTNYDQGFVSKNNKDYVGYKLDWGEILDSEGSGKYRVEFETPSGSLYSEEYCLDQFSTYLADNTVRIGYNWNSVIGDENQKRTRDFVGLDWDNQVRLNDAIFGNKSAAFATDDVRYQSGELRTVSKSFNESYVFNLKRLPVDIFDLFLYDILLSDEILISDYNKANFANYVNHSVEIEGSIEPDYSQSRPEVSISATFKSKYENNRKLYS